MSNFWKVVGQSIIGRSHIRSQLPCQDAWKTANREGIDQVGVTVACVADGAGSVAHAASGAQLVVSLTCNWLLDQFHVAWAQEPERVANQLVRYLAVRMRRAASRLHSPLSGLATTLIAVAVDTHGNWVAFHLGDGGIIGRWGDELRIVSGPQKGEFVNETFFVTDADAAQQMRVVSSRRLTTCDAVSGFLLFSDGMEGSLVSGRSNSIAPAAATILDWLDKYPTADVATALAINIKTLFQTLSDDDCTLVGMSSNQAARGAAVAAETNWENSSTDPKHDCELANAVQSWNELLD